MISLSSALRSLVDGGPDPLVRAAAEAGCHGVAVGADGLLPDVAPLAAAALAAGLSLGPVWAPLGERRPVAGARLPHLASPHRDERAAAAELTRQVIEAVVDLGARMFVLDLGLVTLRVRPADLDVVFRRGELDEDEGKELRAAMMGERRALSGAVLDACRWSVEVVLRVAERHGAALALQLASSPWQAPSPVEAESLLQDFRGAPLGVLWAPAAMDALAALGLRVSGERAAGLARAAAAILATEAVGMETGYLPGQGETDLQGGLRLCGESPNVPVIVSGRPDSSPAELQRAVELVQAWLPR